MEEAGSQEDTEQHLNHGRQKNRCLVILAAGEQNRFEGAGKKHLQIFYGKPLLQRTIEQILSVTENEVTVVTPPEDCQEYRVVISNRVSYRPRQNPIVSDASKYLEALDSSSQHQDLVMLFGDVFLRMLQFEKSAT